MGLAPLASKPSSGTGVPEEMHNISPGNGWKASGNILFKICYCYGKGLSFFGNPEKAEEKISSILQKLLNNK